MESKITELQKGTSVLNQKEDLCLGIKHNVYRIYTIYTLRYSVDHSARKGPVIVFYCHNSVYYIAYIFRRILSEMSLRARHHQIVT
jgi:hypothetical protein